MENIHILSVDFAKRTFAICGTDNLSYVIFMIIILAFITKILA